MSSTSAIPRPTPAEPAVLDDDMTRVDIIDALQRLPFKRAGDRCVVQLDPGVRNFLVQAWRDR